MWQPSKPQWAVIAVAVTTFVYCTWMADRAASDFVDLVFNGGVLDPLLGMRVTGQHYQLVRWSALVGGAFTIWWLQGRRSPSR
jgi:hypothetical protein